MTHLCVQALTHLNATMCDGYSAVMSVQVHHYTKAEATVSNIEAHWHQRHASLSPSVVLKWMILTIIFPRIINP